MPDPTHAITAFVGQLSETKQAVGILASAVAIGIVMGGFGFETVRKTPEVARSAYSLADSLRPIVRSNEARISGLERSDTDRDDQMERIETAIEQIRLNQCLTLAELRGEPNADRCRNQ